ncbi:hypothetical protein [Demequina sp.]|uniref:hypothetical protein n=1 Tax=Demequina sp. TaxID=2050685 RepID=UPI003A8808A1
MRASKVVAIVFGFGAAFCVGSLVVIAVASLFIPDKPRASESEDPAPSANEASATPAADATPSATPETSASATATPTAAAELQPEPKPEPISRPMLSTKYGVDAAELPPVDWGVLDTFDELTLRAPGRYEMSQEYDSKGADFGPAQVDAGPADRVRWYLEHADDDFLDALRIS